MPSLPTITTNRAYNTGVPSCGILVVDTEATCGPNINQGTNWCSELVMLSAIHYIPDSKEVLKSNLVFTIYVKPTENPQLTDYFLKLTNNTITQEMVDSGASFCYALRSFNKWRSDNNLLTCPMVFSGDYDLGFIMGTKIGLIPGQIHRQGHLSYNRLTEQDLRPYMQWINIKFLFKEMVPDVPKINTESMTKHFGLQLSGNHHNALDDVESIANIARELIKMNPMLDWFTPTTCWPDLSVYYSITYTEITGADISETLLNTTTHCTGHVYQIFKVQDKPFVLLGHNEKHNNIASFGGFKEKDVPETLLGTIIREHREETLGCVLSDEELSKLLLTESKLITRSSVKGQHYTTFIEVSSDINLDEANRKFKERLNNPELTEDERENDYLVLVSLDTIRDAVVTNPVTGPIVLVKDINGVQNEIRDINVPAYKWLLSHY
jgi:inhibitor of KinA sporulation pathway (predicted exonuclease)